MKATFNAATQIKFSELKKSKGGSHYLLMWLCYPEGAKDKGDRQIGLVICGKIAQTIDDFFGLMREGNAVLSGNIATRVSTRHGKQRTDTGIEVLHFGVAKPSAEEMIWLDSADFLLFQ